MKDIDLNVERITSINTTKLFDFFSHRKWNTLINNITLSSRNIDTYKYLIDNELFSETLYKLKEIYMRWVDNYDYIHVRFELYIGIKEDRLVLKITDAKANTEEYEAKLKQLPPLMKKDK